MKKEYLRKIANPYVKKPVLKPNYLLSIIFKYKANGLAVFGEHLLTLEKYHQKEKLKEEDNFANVKI